MIQPQMAKEVWPQVRLEWCVFICKILMCLSTLLFVHRKYWYFASSGQSHRQPLEGVMELCVGDFLIESVYNLWKYMKKTVCFLTFGFYQSPSWNWFSFFLCISSQRGAPFFVTRHFFSAPVVRFKSSGQPAEGSGKA